MNWETVSLGDVATIERKTIQPAQLSPNSTYLGLEHIAPGGEIVGATTVAEARVASAKYAFDSDHVLYGKLRPNLGKICRPDFDGVCSTDIFPIRADSSLDRDYLAYFLSQPSIIALASLRASGANLPRLSVKQLEAFQIPVPPIVEQTRIASILDQADKIRTKRRTQIELLDELIRSVFHTHFGDPRNNQLQLPTQKLGELATIVTGNTPSRASRENYGGTLEWVKSNNLGDLRISKAAEFLSEHGRIKARVADAGSVLVTCIAGSPESIGKASIADRTVAFNQQINAILPSPNLDPMFLYFQLQTAPDLVRAKSTGGMKGLVSKSSFASISVLCPPIAEQRSFAEKVEAIQEERDRVERALEVDEELFAALQYRAFRGEL